MRRRIIALLASLGALTLCVYTAIELRSFLGTTYAPIYIPPYHAPTTSPEPPMHVTIPKLNINAPVIPVGFDVNGLMEVPKTAEEVAWYQPGTTPGNNGNAVLAGHYDWTHGPAVFYRIGELQPNDTITVTDAKNQSWVFTVMEIASYPANNFPTEKVFAQSSSHFLNLITCDGTFDTNTKSYANRIVVYTQLTTPSLKNIDKNSDKNIQ